MIGLIILTEAVLVAIVGGAVSVISLIITSIIKYNQDKLHKQINSRMDELLESTRLLAKQEGKTEQKAEQKAEQNEQNK